MESQRAWRGAAYCILGCREVGDEHRGTPMMWLHGSVVTRSTTSVSWQTSGLHFMAPRSPNML